MKLDTLALIAAIVAGALYFLAILTGLLAVFVSNPVIGIMAGFFFCIVVYIIVRLIIGRMKDDPYDRIER